MAIRVHHPQWAEIEPTRLDDGRPGGVIRLPTSDTDIVEIVLSLPLLGQISGQADEIRQSAPAL